MEIIVLKTNLSCSHCVQKVEPLLKNEAGNVDYSIDLEHPDKPVTIFSEGANINTVIGQFKKVGYIAAKL
jgi:copper chaperone